MGNDVNATDKVAKTKLCPIMAALGSGSNCRGSACFLFEFDEELFEGPDSYVAEPGPTGHCGLTRGEK